MIIHHHQLKNQLKKILSQNKVDSVFNLPINEHGNVVFHSKTQLPELQKYAKELELETEKQNSKGKMKKLTRKELMDDINEAMMRGVPVVRGVSVNRMPNENKKSEQKEPVEITNKSVTYK